MDKAKYILLSLLRTGVTGSVRPKDLEPFVDMTAEDWERVASMSYEQGVAAIAVDGLEVLNTFCTSSGASDADKRLFDAWVMAWGLLNSPDQVSLKYEWFGQTFQMEMGYARRWEAACSLAKMFRTNGIDTLVLKGVALNDCYSQPSHRYACDFDCFLLPTDVTAHWDACSLGNELVRAKHIAVNEGYYKNSAFKVPGLAVENHRFCTAWKGYRYGRVFENYLQGLLREGKESIADSVLYRPQPLFNALLLTKHAHQHFLIEDGISLKHVLDWGLFIKKHGDDFDHAEFEKVCRKHGLWKFAESMTRVSCYVLGEADEASLHEPDVYMLKSIFSMAAEKPITDRVGMAKRILRSKQKFRFFSDESRFSCLWFFALGFFKKDKV